MRLAGLLALIAVGCAPPALPIDPQRGPTNGGGDMGGGGSGGTTGGGDMGGGDGMGGPQNGPLFGAPVLFALPPELEGISVAVGDVTGDGQNDVVIGAEAGNGSLGNAAVLVFAQNKAGMLDPYAVYGAGDRGSAYAVAIGDLDGDKRNDVAIVRLGDVGVLLQSASGTLGAAQPLTPTPLLTSQGVDGVAVGDFNADGLTDVAAMRWASPGVDIWFQRADNTLGAAQSFDCPHRGYDDVAVGDLDGDGHSDILLVGEQSWDATYLLQRGGGFAPYGSVPLTHPTTGAIEGAAIGDVDGDGRADFVYTVDDNAPNSRLGLAHRKADGTFATPVLLDSYDGASDVAIADVDGDGHPDVIVAHLFRAIGVYRQRAGGLAAEERYAAPELNWGPRLIAVGDLNGDGRPDLALVTPLQLAILYHQ